MSAGGDITEMRCLSGDGGEEVGGEQIAFGVPTTSNLVSFLFSFAALTAAPLSGLAKRTFGLILGPIGDILPPFLLPRTSPKSRSGSVSTRSGCLLFC